MRTLGLALLMLLAPAGHVTRRDPGAGRARTLAVPASATQNAPAAQALRFRIDAARSRFTVRAFAGGVLWFKGHDHLIGVKGFGGDVSLSPPQLSLRVRADSLAETRDVFTEQQKQIINRELREIVLEADKYPEIVFESTDVEVGRAAADGGFRAKVMGDLTLHGVTRRITIPAEVSTSGGELRARPFHHQAWRLQSPRHLGLPRHRAHPRPAEVHLRHRRAQNG